MVQSVERGVVGIVTRRGELRSFPLEDVLAAKVF
jgi:hypothetical protein